MKYTYFLLLLIAGLVFVQCDKDSDDDDNMNCTILQQAASDALDQKLKTLQTYNRDPSDPTACMNYKEALQNRVEKLQDLLDGGCSANPPVTEQAIQEDQDTIDGLNC